MSSWKQTITQVKDGDPVKASTINTPLDDLTRRTNYLKYLLDQAKAGNATLSTDLPIDSSLPIGTPVYWNSTLSRYEAASVSYHVQNAKLIFGSSSYVAGVLISKSGNTGTVCHGGKITGVDIAGVIPTLSPGQYFLTGTGQLSKSVTSIAVPVLNLLDNDTFIVNIGNTSKYDHSHYTFSLETDAANWISVTPGPAGSPAFRYDLDAHPELKAVWPPIPTSAAIVFVEGLLVGSDEVLVNDDGIWWMSAVAPDVTSIVLMYSNLVGLHDKSIVTSLKTEAPLTLTDCSSGAVSDRGDLVLKLDTITPEAPAVSSVAVKAVTNTEIHTTPVVAGLRSDDGEISIIGGETFTHDDLTYRSGALSIRKSGSIDKLEGSYELAVLNDVGETEYQKVQYYIFRKTRASSVRFKTVMPPVIPSDTKVEFTFWLLNAQVSSGNISGFTAEYRRIPKPSSSALSLPTSDPAITTLSYPQGYADIPGWNYVLAKTEPIEITPGDIVFIDLKRSSQSSDAGVLTMRYNIVE